MNFKKRYIPVDVLLADDDTDDCLFFDKALSAIPVTTHLTIVHDGEQLMNYLFEHSENLPAILFLDLSMPRKNGFECLIEIRENEKFRNLPIVVFTTSFRRDAEYEQVLINTVSKIGVQEYVPKTSDIKHLQDIIHRALIIAIDKRALSDKKESCD